MNLLELGGKFLRRLLENVSAIEKKRGRNESPSLTIVMKKTCNVAQQTKVSGASGATIVVVAETFVDAVPKYFA